MLTEILWKIIEYSTLRVNCFFFSFFNTKLGEQPIPYYWFKKWPWLKNFNIFYLAGCWPHSCKNWKTRELWKADLRQGTLVKIIILLFYNITVNWQVLLDVRSWMNCIILILNLAYVGHCYYLQTLCLRRNAVTKLEGLSTLTTLEELDLYDNQITQIEGLDNLTNLT